MTAIFAHPWGLVALAALPGVLALHLFWRRFRPRKVSGLFLWASESRQIIAGRTRDRLYRTASLLLELLAALALGLAVASPSRLSASRKKHLVVVLDGSASMSASGSDGREFADLAANEARSALSGLAASDEATVIVSGPVAGVAAGPRASPAAALDAIDTFLREPGEPGTPFAETDELGRAMTLARELALPDGRVLALTDTPRPADLVPADVELVAVGEARPNVGFVVADRSVLRESTGDGERVFVGVRNFSGRPAECTVVFKPEKGRDVRQHLGLEAGQTVPVALPLGAGTGIVTAEIEVDADSNALALDDRATLVPSRRPNVAVANLLSGGPGEALARALVSVPGTSTAPPEAAHLVFAPEGKVPSPAAGTWRVVLAGETGEKALRVAGPYVLARDERMLEDVSLRGVLWTASGKGSPAGARPLVSCGDHVLACAFGPDTSRTVVLDLDLARSNLARTAAWPVLVANVLEERRRVLPGLEKANLSLGETVRLRLATLEAEPVLVSADRRERLPGAGLKRAFLARRLGPAEIRQGAERFAALHVNFLSPSESDLARLGSARVGVRSSEAPEKRAGRSKTRAHWPVALLTALGLAAAVGDWYVLRSSGRMDNSIWR
jgi:hypothetical protein